MYVSAALSHTVEWLKALITYQDLKVIIDKKEAEFKPLDRKLAELYKGLSDETRQSEIRLVDSEIAAKKDEIRRL